MLRRITIALALLAYPFALSAAPPSSVPSWFLPHAEDPEAISVAWKYLSTREAAVYLGSSWTVLGGQLVDEKGQPLGFTRLSLSYSEAIRGYGADLITDKDGYFLIYSPYSLDVAESADDPRQYSVCRFYAVPGYPLDSFAARYAVDRKDVKVARAQLLFREADRAFYQLSVDGHHRFEAAGFETFRSEAVKDDREKNAPLVRAASFRDRPREREGETENRKRTAYKLEIVSFDGKLVPHALVKYQANDGYEGNYQVVEANENGQCEVVEYLLKGQDREYYEQVQRQMTVDARLVVGPVSFSLKEDGINTIVVPQPARVAGRITDHRGDPVRTRLRVNYQRQNLTAFELEIPIAADGTFSCDRIMPGERFRITGGGGSRQTTPRAPIASEYLVLGPGEERTINLQVPLASALRILVVDQRNQLVRGEVKLKSGDADDFSNHQESNGKFGFVGLGTAPVRIHFRAEGFEDYLSELTRLEPGELKFLKIIVAPKAKTSSGGNPGNN